MDQEAHFYLFMVILEDPILNNLAVFVQVEEAWELEIVQHDLGEPMRVASAQILIEIGSRAVELMGVGQLESRRPTDLEQLNPNAHEFRSVTIDW